MPAGAYLKPPITEAILEIKFQEKVSEAALKKIKSRLMKTYRNVEDQLQVGFSLKVQSSMSGLNSAAMNQSVAGFRLTSDDGADVIIVQRDGIINSRLAPYNGWAQFSQRIRTILDVCRTNEFGQHKIVRVGMRYVNRLDIPAPQGTSIDPGDWLNLGLYFSEPGTFPGEVSGYTVAAFFPLTNEISSSVRSGTTEAQLIDHSSLLLDIDLFVTGRYAPKNDNDLWELCGRLHEQKNALFERCITDNARTLFDKP